MKLLTLRRLALAALLTVPAAAQAHRAWLLPSATVLSGDEPWVTVDAAISNDLFYFEHFPLQLDGLSIMTPDGSQATAENQARGRYRSTFDVKLAVPGTYRVAVAGEGLFASWRENGQQKRWRGTRESLSREVPANAEQLRVTMSQRRIEFFVTRGAPTDRVLQPLNEGLEMVPITHPNDLVAGEAAKFRLLLDGKPAAGVEVAVVPGGNRYREQLGEMKIVTAEDGSFSVAWTGPGMYWLSAAVRDSNSGVPGAQRNASYIATLEVLPYRDALRAEGMNHVLIPTALAPPSLPNDGVVRQLGGETMGTTWSVRFAGVGDAERLRFGIEGRLARVVAEMSGWRTDSDLCRFNRLPAGEGLVLSAGFRTVLACALAVANSTNGAFDPTIGPLAALWGFGALPARHDGPPPADHVATARACVGWRRLPFDAATGELVQPGALALDLSGIAKGFAVDLVAEGLEAQAIGSYLVDIGGELRGRGVKPDGTPWWVGLERPPEMQGAEPGFVVALHGLSIATSGDYRRCFVHDGRRYGHTLDPRTGWPIDSSLAAVTVLHPSCMQADALATALSVLGPRAGMDYAAHHFIAARLVTRDETGRCTEHLSPALAAMLD